MEETQVVNPEDAQIVSKIDSIVKVARVITITPFGTMEVKGVIKTSDHYKCVNVVIDELPENQCCKDVATEQQIQVLRPGSNKIPVILQNLSCRTLKITKGMQIAHVEASKVIPSFVSSQVSENILKKVAENSPKGNLLKNLPEEDGGRLNIILESLNLQSIESWTDNQQQSAKDLIAEYQHLFTLNLGE